ncbi:MAG: O-antigen ligase family protein [Symbiobacteriia bacterium]
MNKKWWQFPILLLLLGPPLLRTDSRDVLASLTGNMDAWTLLRAAWWGGATLIALTVLVHHARALWASRRTKTVVALGLLWVLSVAASALFSVSPLYTLASAALLGGALLTGLDLYVRLDERVITPEQLLLTTLNVITGLTLLVAVVSIWRPDIVGALSFSGPRFLGGQVASIPDLAVTAILLLIHRLFTVRRRGSILWSIVRLAGFSFVLLVAQNRTSFVQVAVGLFVYFVHYYRGAFKKIRLLLWAATAFLLTIGTAVIIFSPLITSRVWEFLLRNQQNLNNLSGRTEIFSFLWTQALHKPWGLGYAAGTRLAITSNPQFFQVIVARHIGNAHDAYLELLAGAGVQALLLFLVIVLLFLTIRVRRTMTAIAGANRAVMLALLVGGITSSSLVLPFTGSYILLWIFGVGLLYLGSASLAERTGELREGATCGD